MFEHSGLQKICIFPWVISSSRKSMFLFVDVARPYTLMFRVESDKLYILYTKKTTPQFTNSTRKGIFLNKRGFLLFIFFIITTIAPMWYFLSFVFLGIHCTALWSVMLCVNVLHKLNGLTLLTYFKRKTTTMKLWNRDGKKAGNRDTRYERRGWITCGDLGLVVLHTMLDDSSYGDKVRA